MAATPAAEIGHYATDLDPFTRENLLDPYPVYRQLRDIGPLAYMTKHQMWIATRFDEVKRILREPENFSSAGGIGMNPILNEAWQGLLPTLDRPDHTPQRKIYDDVLRPAEVGQYADTMQRQAEHFVEAMIAKRDIDGVADFAEAYPVSVMADLVGFPDDERRKHLVHWATDSYQCCGPLGTFEADSLPNMRKLYDYVVEIANSGTIASNTFAAYALAAVERGEISQQACYGIIGGYATASLDTTANAVGSLLLLLAQYPEQWAIVRDEPEFLLSTIREALRLETPAQWFTRVTTCEVEFGDITLPKGTRLMHSYGAANRDERRFPDPDRFDARRNPSNALTFGFGIHSCPGQHISNMETRALLSALIRRVDHLELRGTPRWRLHNLTRGLAVLPLRIHARV
jgi:cytochrome P450